MQNNRYPKIHVRSKNELIKRLKHRNLTEEQAADLVNDSLQNFEKYWRDHSRLSRPADKKWVRDASYTNLGKLLDLINTILLKRHDGILPNFIFGGISGRDHKAAVRHLLGNKRGRVLLKLDIARFYEQITQARVEQFFALKADCGKQGSALLARLCCVPIGAKDHPGNYRTIARGFATSSRLAVWCNLDVFIKLERLVNQELKGKDPRVAIYVDDIGITASRVSKEDMMSLFQKVRAILESDPKQKLPLNTKKTQIILHSGETYNIEGNLIGRWGFEHLGIRMKRNSLTPGTKTSWKFVDVKQRLKAVKGKSSKLRQTKKSLSIYKRYVER